jgi:hypothetical protein
MEVSFSDSFKKVFRKKVKSTEIESEFWERLELIVNDPLKRNTGFVRKKSFVLLPDFRWVETGRYCFRCAIPICFRRVLP